MFLLIYQVLILIFLCIFGNFLVILKKVVVYVEVKNIDLCIFIDVWLVLDMFFLVCQVQIVSDVVKGVGVWLVGLEVLSYVDMEIIFDEFQVCIVCIVEFFEGICEE